MKISILFFQFLVQFAISLDSKASRYEIIQRTFVNFWNSSYRLFGDYYSIDSTYSTKIVNSKYGCHKICNQNATCLSFVKILAPSPACIFFSSYPNLLTDTQIKPNSTLYLKFIRDQPVRIIESVKVTDFGDWYEPVYCPYNSFANGIQVKMDYTSGSNDNSGLVSIKLICNDAMNTTIMKGDLGFGTWSNPKVCVNNTELIGFSLYSMPYQGPNTDDLGAIGIKVQCEDNNDLVETLSDFTSIIPSDIIYCPNQFAICGYQIQIERNYGDCSSANNLKFYCCNKNL